MEFPSSRLFSLHVPMPPKVFLSMVYKFEGSTDVQVALELTTGDASSCHVGGMLVLNGEKLSNFVEEKALALGWASVGELLWAGPLWVGFCGQGCCGWGCCGRVWAASTLGGIWIVIITIEIC